MPDTKITALTAIGANPIIPATFPIPMVDLTDTSMAASGTTKKVTVNQILGAGGTATLASATITGDLTVDTNVLKVDSTNNRVGIGTATPSKDLEVANAGADCRVRINSTSVVATEYFRSGTGLWLVGSDSTNAFKIARASNFGGSGEYFSIASATGAATWLDGSGGTRMTLDSSGLGVGVSPATSSKIHTLGNGTNVYAIFQNGDTLATNKTSQLWLSNGPTFLGANNREYRIVNIGTSATAADLVFDYWTGTAIAERMRIDSSGNVGIGVTPTTIVGGSGANGKGLQGDSWTISSQGGSNDAYFGCNIYTSAYGVWSNRVNAASGAYYISGGTHIFYRGAAQAAGTISPTESARIDASGNLILQPSSTPPSLFANGQLTVNATSDTNLRFSYRGSDGVTRTANLTLAP